MPPRLDDDGFNEQFHLRNSYHLPRALVASTMLRISFGGRRISCDGRRISLPSGPVILGLLRGHDKIPIAILPDLLLGLLAILCDVRVPLKM